MRGASNAIRDQLGAIVHRMIIVSQKMRPGGNTPWWQQVPDAAEEMTYECDARLGAPQPVDCAKVEYGELGLNDDTFSVTAGLAKVLSSGQCSRCLDDTRPSVLTRACQVRVNSSSRQRQPSRSTGAKSVEQWTLSLTSASILRSTQAPAAGLLSGIKLESAVELAGKSDRMTTNSVVNGHCPEVVRKAWTDSDRVERSTRWGYYDDIGHACTATGTTAWPEFYFGRQLYDSGECYVCCAGDLTRQSAIGRSGPEHLSITIANGK